jgi:hypothetical protein
MRAETFRSIMTGPPRALRVSWARKKAFEKQASWWTFFLSPPLQPNGKVFQSVLIRFAKYKLLTKLEFFHPAVPQTPHQFAYVNKAQYCTFYLQALFFFTRMCAIVIGILLPT